jgi:hypothetical protein
MTIRVFCGGGKLLIAEEEQQRRSWRDNEDGRHPHCHRAAWRPREDDDLFSLNPKRYLGWLVGLLPSGLWPGKCFPLFFSSDSFLFIYLFSVLNSNSNLLFCFAGLN